MQLPPLISGILIRRYKRFLADIRLDTGKEIIAFFIDPVYSHTLYKAIDDGVEIIAVQARITETSITLERMLPVVL